MEEEWSYGLRMSLVEEEWSYLRSDKSGAGEAMSFHRIKI